MPMPFSITVPYRPRKPRKRVADISVCSELVGQLGTCHCELKAIRNEFACCFEVRHGLESKILETYAAGGWVGRPQFLFFAWTTY